MSHHNFNLPPDWNCTTQILPEEIYGLFNPDGKKIPSHVFLFKEGQSVTINAYTFRVSKVADAYIVLEPVGPYIIEVENVDKK